MSDNEEARVLDVFERAQADLDTLDRLTPEERYAFIAGRAERAWLRAGLFIVGMVVGVCLIALAGGY